MSDFQRSNSNETRLVCVFVPEYACLSVLSISLHETYAEYAYGRTHDEIQPTEIAREKGCCDEIQFGSFVSYIVETFRCNYKCFWE